ncbi:MAG TPA: DUF2252 family protein [Flavipsychrobacter sp.]|nr:DUF2252 family protein [Flavipsychrobacter sp.]
MSQLSERIKKFNKPLLEEMVQLKYEAMLENAFRFFRGTCHLFYEDLATAKPLPLSPLAWICGDLHIENFGSFRGQNGLVYFDLNDFDEGVLAPAAYEVVRMVTSIFIAFDALSIPRKKATKMAQLFVRSYASTLSSTKAISIDPRIARGIVCEFLNSAKKHSEKDILKKRTINKKSKRILSLEDERHFKLEKPLKKELNAHINDWISTSSDGPYNFKVIGSVFRFAGTGSLGVKRYLFLLKSTNTKNKYLLLDMKQARPSSVLPFIDVQQLQWKTEADRVTSIQCRMQNVPSALLSTTIFNDEPYVIQELQPVKDTIKFKLLVDDYRGMYQVINDMGSLTASAQLRSGGMQGSGNIDDLCAFGKDEGWQQRVLDYAEEYAAHVSKDYQQFVKEYKQGLFTNT